MNYLALGCIVTSLSCSAAYAAPCNININHGIVIDPSHIRILDHNRTVMQINSPRQLFIGGREIHLTLQQQALLEQYSSGIRKQVPEIVSIAIDSLELGLKAVNKVIARLTGENSAAHQKVQEKFSKVQMLLHKRFSHSDHNYFIAPQDFDNFDDLFSGEFELELEEIISASTGTIIERVKQAISNHEQRTEQNSEQSLEQNTELSIELSAALQASEISSSAQQLATFAQELKLEMGSHANELDNKAEQFCQGLIKLNKIETQLKQQIPELSQFALIDVK